MNKQAALDTLMAETSPEQRRAAAEALIEQDHFDFAVLQAFARGLHDEDRGVQDICSMALTHDVESQSDEKAFAVAPVTLHPDIEVRNLAGDILLKLGHSSVKALAPYLYHDDFDVRKYACDIIGLVGSREDAALVMPLLDDSDVNARYAAIEALGNMRAEEAIGYMLGMYVHDEEARPFILEALGKTGGEVAQSFLLSNLRNESDPLLQMASIDALALCATLPYLSEQLMHSLPAFGKEVQPLVVKAIVAINARSEVPVEFPPELRSIAHLAIYSDDPDESQAGILALGTVYSKEDREPLVYVLGTAALEIRAHILANLFCSSPLDVVVDFFGSLLTTAEHNENVISDGMAAALRFAEYIPPETSNAIVSMIVNCAAHTNSNAMTDILHLAARMNMNTFITALDSLLASGNTPVVDEVIEIIKVCEVEPLIPRLQELAIRDDSTGQHARQVLEQMNFH